MQQKLPFIEALVRVSDGSFETRLVVPLNASKEQLQSVGKMWMNALLSFCQQTTNGKDENETAN